MSKDYYAILGIQKSASDDEVKKAFRRLAHEHHPDKGGNASKFKDINEAYQILSDKQKRSTYDQFGSAAFEQGGPGAGGGPGFGGFGGFGGFDFNGAQFQGQDFGDLGDILGQMFGFGGQERGGSSAKARGKDIEMDVMLTFREAAFGCEQKMKLFRPTSCSRCHGQGAEPGSKLVTCTTCSGTGQVRQQQRTMFGTMQTVGMCAACHGRGQTPEKACTTCHGNGLERREEELRITIPAGLNTDEVLKMAGGGEGAPFGGRPGDLYLHVRVKADPNFTREGNDVISEAKVPFSILTLGGLVEVETLDGKTNVKIAEGTVSGATIVLRGQGIVYGSSNRRGDQRITVTADVPKHLTKEQKVAMEALKKVGL